MVPILLAYFAVFGLAVKWPKVRGGVQFQWIGYWTDLEKYRIGISEKRRAWVVFWIQQLLDDKPTEADFDSGLGRLCFVCNAIVWDRPFLAPLYALAAAVRRKSGGKVDCTKLPPYIKVVLLHLKDRLLARRTIHCERGRPRVGTSIERFRSDAKAEGDLVTIGGYQSHDSAGRPIPHSEAKWFYLVLTKSTAPWAFCKGEPFRTIASLELLGSLIAIMLLLDPNESQEDDLFGTLSVGGLTDNSGNRFAVARMMSTKWPLSAFVSEMAVQLEERGLLFELQWIPREQNTEADAITNGDFTWLNPLRRLDVILERLPFLVLPKLLKEGAVFYKDIDTVNVGVPPAKKPDKLLKI
jgi:hypothetical protein